MFFAQNVSRILSFCSTSTVCSKYEHLQITRFIEEFTANERNSKKDINSAAFQ